MATCISNNSLFSATLLNDAKFVRVCKYASPVVSVSNSKPDSSRSRVKAVVKEEEIESPSSTSSAEEVTQKFGLEAGLWKVLVMASV